MFLVTIIGTSILMQIQVKQLQLLLQLSVIFLNVNHLLTFYDLLVQLFLSFGVLHFHY